MDTNNNTTTGIVTEALPNTMFRVRVPKTLLNEHPAVEKKEQEYNEIIAYLGGKMKFKPNAKRLIEYFDDNNNYLQPDREGVVNVPKGSPAVALSFSNITFFVFN